MAKSTVKRKRKSKPTQKSNFVGSRSKKLPKPDRQQLKSSYKLLMTSLPEVRINALIAAVKWYDEALEWVNDNIKKKVKLQTLPKLKAIESVENIRAMSLKEKSNQRKEQYLKNLIEKYEVLFKGILRTKTLSSVYSKLSKASARLLKRSKRLEAKYSTVIGILEDSLKPQNASRLPVQFKVGDTKQDRNVSGDFRTLIYSRAYAQKILTTFRQQGLFPLVVGELELLSRIGGFKRIGGEDKIDTQSSRDALFRMLNNLIDYCQHNPKIGRRLIKVKRKKRKTK